MAKTNYEKLFFIGPTAQDGELQAQIWPILRKLLKLQYQEIGSIEVMEGKILSVLEI